MTLILCEGFEVSNVRMDEGAGACGRVNANAKEAAFVASGTPLGDSLHKSLPAAAGLRELNYLSKTLPLSGNYWKCSMAG